MIENKYVAIVKRAYESNELTKLFSCEESYSLNENGEYYLKEDSRLTGSAPEQLDPINIEALISAAEIFYCSLDKRSGQKDAFIVCFVDALGKLIESKDPNGLYFATKIYNVIKERTEKDIFYPLIFKLN